MANPEQKMLLRLNEGNEAGFKKIFGLFVPATYDFLLRHRLSEQTATTLTAKAFEELRAAIAGGKSFTTFFELVLFLQDKARLKAGEHKAYLKRELAAAGCTLTPDLIRESFTVLSGMPPPVRKVFTLHHIRGLTIADTAKTARLSLAEARRLDRQGRHILAGYQKAGEQMAKKGTRFISKTSKLQITL